MITYFAIILVMLTLVGLPLVFASALASGGVAVLGFALMAGSLWLAWIRVLGWDAG